MTGSNKAKAGGRGRPFVKGDPRINRDHGPRCSEAAAFSLNAINALATHLTPDEWAKIVADRARRGMPWAIQLYADLLIEKPTQKHEHTGDVNLNANLTINVVQVGNGGDK